LLGYLVILGLEHPTLILAIRLQFELAARMSEILNLRWDWVDLANRRIAWPDSKEIEILLQRLCAPA
jgi:integrase